MTFPCVKHAYTKIQIYKYTNTAYDKVPERPSMWYNTVAVLSLCQLSIVDCSKSSKDFCTVIHSGLLYYELGVLGELGEQGELGEFDELVELVANPCFPIFRHFWP